MDCTHVLQHSFFPQTSRKYFSDPDYNHIWLFLQINIWSSQRYRQGFGYIGFEFLVLVPRKCHLRRDLLPLKQMSLKGAARNVKLSNSFQRTLSLPRLCCKEGVKINNTYHLPINKGKTFWFHKNTLKEEKHFMEGQNRKSVHTSTKVQNFLCSIEHIS